MTKSTHLSLNETLKITVVLILAGLVSSSAQSSKKGLVIGDAGYFEMPGLNVLVYNNTFLEGHQSGVEIIQHGNRIATNGELRLSPTPGQWQPIPKFGVGYESRGVSPQAVDLEGRVVDKENNTISIPCSYPNKNRDSQGFNPIIYPDLELGYKVSVQAEGSSFTITVDLDDPLPEKYVGKVGYNIELFPGDLYGKTYFMDGKGGIFPRQANGPVYLNDENESEHVPLAEGNELTIAPESDLLKITIKSDGPSMVLVDGSIKHNNGWFTVRSLVPAGATKGAIKWTITPNVIPNWINEPIVHLSQVGYHPGQRKIAYIELDKNDKTLETASLLRLEKNGSTTLIKEETPKVWGRYMRYKYAELDFSDITEEGMYLVKYGNVKTNVFSINKDVYKRHVWQPTLEYFIPVQMCHMRVNQKYRVWHGACHLDDALMAPFNVKHFDGYNNEDETIPNPKYKPLEHVPGLNVGGWHDAGDYDLRIESQAETVLALAYTYEEFGIDYDQTFVDQANHHVELFQPDGKADILQQVEHGVLAILSGYRAMGELYRGIIVPTLRQYVHLGDALTQTDNKIFDNAEQREKANQIHDLWFKKVANRYSNVFDPGLNANQIEVVAPELDDRLVFMETNPSAQLEGGAALVAASRVLKNYDANLAKECLETAEALWAKNKDGEGRFFAMSKIQILTELIKATDKQEYKDALYDLAPDVRIAFRRIGWSLGSVLELLDNQDFKDSVNAAAKAFNPMVEKIVKESPFGSTLAHTEYLAYQQYWLYKYWPDLYPAEYMFNIVNYLLGCRPGNTTNSLVSGVGVNSPVVAYGNNRADWSYIPGGTFWNAVNTVSPDMAEDKVWPYLWQEREYIITSPCYFMFSVIATDRILNGK